MERGHFQKLSGWIPQEPQPGLLFQLEQCDCESGSIVFSTSGFISSRIGISICRIFAYNHIGLSRSSYEGNGHLARKLRPAIEELQAKGFLEPLTEQARFERRSRSEWRILLVRGKGVPSGLPLFESEASEPTPQPKPQPNRKQKTEPEPTPLERELITRGVTVSTARELVAEYPGERITVQIDQVDWLREKRPRKISDPAAYLVKAIQNDYAAPEGFVSRAERARREEAELEKQRQKEQAKRQKDAEDAPSGRFRTGFSNTGMP